MSRAVVRFLERELKLAKKQMLRVLDSVEADPFVPAPRVSERVRRLSYACDEIRRLLRRAKAPAAGAKGKA